MARKSSRSATSLKPSKSFPLTAHRGAAQWCKKHRGRTHYFGSLADPDAALERYQHDWPYILRGETPPPMGSDGLTVADLCNEFHAATQAKLNEGRITRRRFAELYRTCDSLVAFFGRSRRVADLGAPDFRSLRADLAKTLGPVSLGNAIGRVRQVFNHAYYDGLIDAPVRFGADFRKPTRNEIEKRQAARGESDCRTFAAAELRSILAELDGKPALRAMVLLSLNAGYGATDLASLRMQDVDLEAGWARSRRGKTGAPRGAKLWPETVTAIVAYLTKRPKPRDKADVDTLFLTAKGKQWVRQSGGNDPARWVHRTDLIGNAFSKVLRKLDINGRRGVYNIRHTAATIADEVGDRQATQYLMGHRDGSQTANYVHKPPSDERMEALAARVRAWMWEGGDA